MEHSQSPVIDVMTCFSLAQKPTTMKLLSALFLMLAMLLGSVVLAGDNPNPPLSKTLRRIKVPILMFHYVSDLPPHADNIRRGLTVTPTVFQAQMQYLHDNGFNTISLYDLNNALTQGTPLPDKPIVLTFDDGYLDAYTNVFPTLKQYSFTGTFFIITSRPDANDPKYMSWPQIKEMSDAGMSMEPHTKDHLDLRGRDHDFLIYQMQGSIESLAAYTGRTPHMFAYPVGHYDAYTLKVAKELGLWLAVTTRNGDLQTTSGRLRLPRIRVTENMPVTALAAVLRKAY